MCEYLIHTCFINGGEIFDMSITKPGFLAKTKQLFLIIEFWIIYVLSYQGHI